MVNRGVGENDLHAFVDGYLEKKRRHEVVTYLATHPAAAERVRAFFEQQAALTALRDSLADNQAGAPWPELGRTLGRKVREQQRTTRQRRRTRRTIIAVSTVAPIVTPASQP